jgi:hypothetical protein
MRMRFRILTPTGGIRGRSEAAVGEIGSVETQQAVEKGSSALLRSIASLQRIGKYASARRFLARLASEAFLNSLNLSFSTLCQEMG